MSDRRRPQRPPQSRIGHPATPVVTWKDVRGARLKRAAPDSHCESEMKGVTRLCLDHRVEGSVLRVSTIQHATA
jgi:hypothetical protein